MTASDLPNPDDAPTPRRARESQGGGEEGPLRTAV
jgi:hypothetical protein